MDEPGIRPKRSIWTLFSPRGRTQLAGGFQRRYLVTQFAGLLVSLTLLTAVLFIPSIIAVLGANPGARLEAANRFLALHDLAWPLMGMVLILVGYFTVLHTHRLAGPLYGFRLVFRDVERGVLTKRVATRRNDYLAIEANELDQMIASLRTRISSAQAEVAQAREEVIELSRQDQLGSGASVKALSESLARAQSILDQFETGREVSSAEERQESRAAEAALQADSPSVTPARQHGFTLIEMMIVFAIVGTVAALAVPAYSHALESARVTRAMGDIRTIGREAKVNQALQGCLPSSLAEIGMDILRDPWDRPYQYGVIAQPGNGGPPICIACSAACISVAQARKDASLDPLNSDFDIYSLGPDGLSALPVSDPDSQDDIVRANDGGFFGRGSEY